MLLLKCISRIFSIYIFLIISCIKGYKQRNRLTFFITSILSPSFLTSINFCPLFLQKFWVQKKETKILFCCWRLQSRLERLIFSIMGTMVKQKYRQRQENLEVIKGTVTEQTSEIISNHKKPPQKIF